MNKQMSIFKGVSASMMSNIHIFRCATYRFFVSTRERTFFSKKENKIGNCHFGGKHIFTLSSKYKQNNSDKDYCENIISDLDNDGFSKTSLLQERIRVLENDVNNYINQIDEYKEKYIRSIAENENLRQRYKKDIESARIYSISNFAKGLLDVVDNLSKALSSIEIDKIEKDSQIYSLYNGINMTLFILNKVLEDNGIVKFSSLGKLFNPKEHEAVFEKIDPSKPKGLICEELQPGYRIKDRILRAAKVGTIKNQ